MAKPRTVKLRRRRVPTERGAGTYDIYSLQVPTELAEHLPVGSRFTAEFTADGLLFRPVLDRGHVRPPDWVTQLKPEVDHAPESQSQKV